MIRAFIRSYLGSLLFSLLYLIMIQKNFQQHEVYMIMIVLCFANLFACFAYFIGILWPFYFLLKAQLALLTLREAVLKYLFYFAIIPVVLCTLFISIYIENSTSGMQFSVLMIDASALIYLGFIHSLKSKTIS